MRFLLALDLDREPLDTLLASQRLLGPLGTRFDLLFVDATRTGADFLAEPELRDQALGLWDKHRVRYQNKLEMLLFRLPHAARGKALVHLGDPSRVILNLAEGYDGVVVGGRPRAPLSRARSTIADRVVQACPIPVIVVRAGDPVSRVEPLPPALPGETGEGGFTGVVLAENVLPFRRQTRSSP